MNPIEEKLWSYIDGTCNESDKLTIARLIEEDDVYRRMYQEILAFNQELAEMELDEPSMPFTYNVMEAIRQEEALKPLKANIDTRIIKGIAAFFILTISALLIYLFSTINWSAGPANSMSINFKMPSIKTYISGPVMQGFIFFDVILGLYLFDGYLRKRNVSKSA